MAKKIAISGIIGWDVTARLMREALIDAKGEDVEFEVSSPGGFIAPGLEIFNLIRDYPGKTTAVLKGYAMSMASYIPLACDRVVAYDNAVYMIHNARGGAWGDHNDVLKYGAYLKGLSGIMVKKYMKRTGKSEQAVRELMDAETFFFGDEMVEHGFVDEIIESGKKDDDADTAKASARAVFADAMAQLATDQNAIKDDIIAAARAMALADVTPPAAAGDNKEEDQQMSKTLAVVLAENPTAKAEHDAAIAAARLEGEKAGKDEVQARITAASPYLTSTEYPQAVRETAVKTITGEVPVASLTTVVAAVDAVRQEQASKAATDDTAKKGDTPAAQGDKPVDPAAVISDDAGLEAAIARSKGGN